MMNEGGNFTWQYLPGSDLKSKVTYPNGVTVDYAYEPQRDLLTSVRNYRGSTIYSEYIYENDALGRRTAKNNEQYGYNVRSELTAASGNGNYAYLYDDIGNRVTSSECGTNSSYTANCLNQYTNVEYSTVQPSTSNLQPSYDADGNQTLVKTATGIWSVTYNGENRPVCWSNGTTVVTMDFDRMGRRAYYREMNGNSQVTFTRFLYDGYVMIQQLFSNSPYNVYKEFVWDPTEPVATKPLCFRQYGESDAYLMHDGNKNVTDVIAANTTAAQLAHYPNNPNNWGFDGTAYKKCPEGSKIINIGDGTMAYFRTNVDNSKKKEYNGCGAKGGQKFPDTYIGLVDFTSCCNNHDICYGTCGSNRNSCDKGLGDCMRGKCEQMLKYVPHEKALCKMMADTYEAAVSSVFADSAFEAGQDSGCIWRPCCKAK